MINYFRKALNRKGLIHAGNSEWSIAMQCADKAIVTPMIYDSTYISFLLEYCINHQISLIVPLFDIDLPILAQNKQLFKDNGITLVISDFNFTQICNDKWNTYHFLKNKGFNVPETYLNIEECHNDLNRGKISFPIIIKPRWGMGSIGIYEAENNNELKIFYDKTKRNIFESYLKFESRVDPENAVIMQEKLIGQEHGLDIFNDLQGKFLTCIPKKKIAMRAGETDSAIIIDDPNFYNIGKTLSTKTKHIGNLDVDCFQTKKGIFILEMNCRFGGQYPFSHLAGANFPKAILNMAQNKKTSKSLLTAKVGIIGIKDIVPTKLIKRT